MSPPSWIPLPPPTPLRANFHGHYQAEQIIWTLWTNLSWHSLMFFFCLMLLLSDCPLHLVNAELLSVTGPFVLLHNLKSFAVSLWEHFEWFGLKIIFITSTNLHVAYKRILLTSFYVVCFFPDDVIKASSFQEAWLENMDSKKCKLEDK